MNRKEILKEILETLRELQELNIRQELFLLGPGELQTLEIDKPNDNLDTGEFNDPDLIGFSLWNSITRPVEDS
jgi:hypothetical protein